MSEVSYWIMRVQSHIVEQDRQKRKDGARHQEVIMKIIRAQINATRQSITDRVINDGLALRHKGIAWENRRRSDHVVKTCSCPNAG